MSALEEARRVMVWATRAEGPPPRGGLSAIGALASPSAEARATLGALAAAHTARIGWGSPPLGDSTPPGLGTLLIAAAIARRDTPPVALEILHACPAARSGWDLVAHDAVVGPALAMSTMDESVADALRSASPLSALLDRPAAGEEDAVFAWAVTHLTKPAFQRTLVAAFATMAPRGGLCADPSPSVIAGDVRLFRRRVLHRLRTLGEASRRLVLEVYEAALLHHREATLADVALASKMLFSEDPGMNPEDALARASFWGPLWEIERAYPEELRAMRIDVEGRLAGTKLYALARSLSGGAV